MKKLLPLLLVLVMPLTALAEEKKDTPDPLKQAVSEMIQKATTTVGEAKDFLIQELPDVVRQFLRWKMAENLGWFLVLGAIATFAGILLMRLFRFMTGPDDPDEPVLWMFWTVGVVIFLVLSSASLSYLFAVAEIAIAPKVYLIEYAHDLIK